MKQRFLLRQRQLAHLSCSRAPLFLHGAPFLCITLYRFGAIMGRLLILVTALILFFGCAHIHQCSDYSAVNARMDGRDTRIELLEGVYIEVWDAQIAADSISWHDAQNGIKCAIATSEVHQLVILNRFQGALDGFLSYLIVGGVLGLSVALVNAADPESAFLAMAVIAGAGGLSGVVIGAPIGALVGSKDVYVINQRRLEE